MISLNRHWIFFVLIKSLKKGVLDIQFLKFSCGGFVLIFPFLQLCKVLNFQTLCMI